MSHSLSVEKGMQLTKFKSRTTRDLIIIKINSVTDTYYNANTSKANGSPFAFLWRNGILLAHMNGNC